MAAYRQITSYHEKLVLSVKSQTGHMHCRTKKFVTSHLVMHICVLHYDLGIVYIFVMLFMFQICVRTIEHPKFFFDHIAKKNFIYLNFMLKKT